MNLRSSSATVVHLRDRQRLSARAEILAAAERVFARDGLAAARMDAIAREAGVAVGTLYNHFDDRERLIWAVNESHRSELLTRVDQAIESASTGREQVEAVVEAVFEHLELHADFMRILMEAEHGHSRIKPIMQGLYERTERVVQRALKRKELRGDDSEYLPALLLGMFRGVMIRRMKSGESEDPARVARLVARTFFDGAGRKR